MHDRQGTAKSTSQHVPPVVEERIGLAELMLRHAGAIRKVPGQEVEVLASTLGYERASIYTLPNASKFESNIQFLFSIIAFDKRAKPIATLTLMENYERVKDTNLLLAFIDTSQDALIEYLKRREAPLSAYTETNSYFDAIRSLIDTVGKDIIWA